MTSAGSSFAADSMAATKGLLESAGSLAALNSAALSFQGEAPHLSTRHRIVVAQAAAVASVAALVADRWHQATGEGQEIVIDALQAACSLNSPNFQRQNGYRISPNLIVKELKSDFYRTADGRWFFPCGFYPDLRDGALELLGCPNTSDAISQSIAAWHADDLELAFGKLGLTGNYVRTAQEWASHPQGQALAAVPTIVIEKIGDSEPEPQACRERPLDDVRVLDMAHVIAGPVVSRTLAEHGAGVLRLSPPTRPDIQSLVMDTGIGKRSAYIDLSQKGDVDKLLGLLPKADVFVESWRPEGMANHGLAPVDVARHRPGIVYVSVSCFGFNGPWAGRKGFEQLAQSVSGVAVTEGESGLPRFVPTQLLTDYMTGYLGAVGALAALRRRSAEGGSYHVKVSLARTSMWIQSLGLQDIPSKAADFDALAPLMDSRDSPFGRLRQLAPVAQFSKTPAYWSSPPSLLGSHPASWSFI